MTDLVSLRHKLHSIAELSGSEFQTSNLIFEFLETLNPHILQKDVGGQGVIAVFDSGKPGHTIMFRADMDALPIVETNELTYASANNIASHKCGHDGHVAILFGFAEYCAQTLPMKGKIILLFQAAEETGIGALNTLNDERFAVLKPDFSFAIHNLPGLPLNSIVVRDQTFAAASKGMIIKLTGINSHASEPEKGVSPGASLSDLINRLPLLANEEMNINYSLITIVHASLGVPAFGTNPAEAVLMLTLRAFSNSVIDSVTEKILHTVKEVASIQRLKYSIEYADVFPATVNHHEAVEIVRNASRRLELNILELESPFKWSEDFAHFTQNSRGALFGIGSGVNHLPLHNPLYDFPDAIIETGVQIWKGIYQELNF